MAPSPTLRFVPECHADTTLVRFLTNGYPDIDHERGIGDVANNLESIKVAHAILVGIVDDDRRQPTYLKDFDLLEKENGVLLKKKPGAEHYVISVMPAIEKFLIENCKSIGEKPSDYGFPDDLKQFCKHTKKPEIEQNQRFIDLLKELKTKNAPGMLTLEKMLTQFLEQ